MSATLSFGLVLLRLSVGLVIAAHGAQKLFGWWNGPGLDGFTGMMEKVQVRPARPVALLAAVGELGGGLLVVLGFLGPLGPLAVAGGMVVAIVTVHLAKGFWNSKGGYEFPLLLMGGALALSFTGFGAISLDGLLRLALPEPLTWIVCALAGFGGAGAALASRQLAARSLELG